jgi:hypothetical protein
MGDYALVPNSSTPPSPIVMRLIHFQKIIPLVISSVSIGVCTVNRTTIKWMIHIGMAIIVASVSYCFFKSPFTTAFLFASFAYVLTCANINGSVDVFLQIGMSVGFSVLWFIDMYVEYLDKSNPTTPFQFYIRYLLTALISGFIGVFAVYIVKTAYPKNMGKEYLYDFKGCSCDDCVKTNQCGSSGSSGSSATRVLMRRI